MLAHVTHMCIDSIDEPHKSVESPIDVTTVSVEEHLTWFTMDLTNILLPRYKCTRSISVVPMVYCDIK